MVKKYCDLCRSESYSSNATGRWICPHCGNDLTGKPINHICFFQDLVYKE